MADAVECDGCGQKDDHPKIHIWGVWQKNDRTSVSDPSFHFDCLPAQYESELVGPQHAVTVAAIEAARNGTHGEKLYKLIQDQPDDNNLPDEELTHSG